MALLFEYCISELSIQSQASILELNVDRKDDKVNDKAVVNRKPNHVVYSMRVGSVLYSRSVPHHSTTAARTN